MPPCPRPLVDRNLGGTDALRSLGPMRRGEPDVQEISRRQVLKLGLATAVVGALPGTLTAGSSAAAPARRHGRADEFRQPPVQKSAHRLLAVTLTAVPGVVGIGAAKPVTTYTYDGGLPGSTWVLDPGDTL